MWNGFGMCHKFYGMILRERPHMTISSALLSKLSLENLFHFCLDSAVIQSVREHNASLKLVRTYCFWKWIYLILSQRFSINPMSGRHRSFAEGKRV